MVFRDLDKQALKQNAYTVLSKITVIEDGTVFTEENNIVDWTYEDYRYVPDTGFVGQFVERILDGSLRDMAPDYILENKEINLQLGIVNGIDKKTTYYDYGNFLITKVKYKDTTGEVSYESADYTKKFNKLYEDTITYPCTALQLAQNVCQQAGVELGSTNFTNKDFIIDSCQYDSDATLRDVIKDIGKLAFSWVRIGTDNKCYIDFEQQLEENVDEYNTLTTNEYYESRKQDLYFGKVNKIVIGMKDIEGENAVAVSPDYTEETECAIKIYDNNLTYTPELRQQALNGCEKLFGLKYIPLEINTIGHPWLEGNDLIKLINVDNDILYTYPFDRQINYSGYITETISSSAPTKKQSEYEFEGNLESAVKKTRIIVDKQNQEITALSEKIDSSVGQFQISNKSSGRVVTTENAGNYLPVDFLFYGDSYQETRSGKNLFDINNQYKVGESFTYGGITTTYNENGYITLNGTASRNGDINIVPQYYTITLDKDVYLCFEKVSGSISGSIAVNKGFACQAINKSGESIWTYFVKESDPIMKVPYSDIVSIRWLRISISNGEIFTNYKIRCWVSTENTLDFELFGASPSPEYPSEIDVVDGIRNLFDMTNENKFTFRMKGSSPNYQSYKLVSKSTNEIRVKGGGGNYTEAYIDVTGLQPNTKYSISFTITENTTGYTPSMVLQNNGITDSTGNITIGLGLNNGSTAIGTDKYVTFSNIQLEEGSTPHDYIPYGQNYLPLIIQSDNIENQKVVNLPLDNNYFVKLGDVRDVGKIDFTTSRLVKEENIGKVVLNGDEEWGYYSNTFYCPLNGYLKKEAITTMCDYYRSTVNINGGAQAYSRGNNTISLYREEGSINRIYLRDDRFTTVDDFKLCLKENPVTVYYILATSNTKYIDLDSSTFEQLRLNQGYNELYIDDTLEADMYLKYLTDSELNVQYAKTAELQLTNNQIRSEVSEKTTIYDRQFEEVNNNLDSKLSNDDLAPILANYASTDSVTEVEKKVTEVQTSTNQYIGIVQNIQQNGVTQVRTETGFTFDKDGLTVSKSGAPTKTLVDEDGMKVYSTTGPSQQEMQRTDSTGTYSENVTVRKYLIVGTHTRFEDYSNGTGAFFIG